MPPARPDTAWQPAPVREFGRPDLYIAIALFVFSWLIAAFYLPAFRAGGGTPQFYQSDFGPAVMSACGRGYVNVDAQTIPPLAAFLDTRVNTFACSDLPAHPAPAQLGLLPDICRYLMLSTALVWRVAGVSWRAVDILLSALFALSLTAGYIALRFVAGRALSITGTLLWLVSPMHLGNLPHLRDYSKTPFFILTLVAMAVILRERRPARLLLAGACFGLAQGLGFGMRTDVILNFAPFLLVLFAGGAQRLRDQLPIKFACAGVVFAVFTVAAWPILHAYGDTDAMSHVALLGLTTPFDAPLGIRPAPYDFGYVYNDGFVVAEVTGNWARSTAGVTSMAPAAVPYAKGARAYYLALATMFPGDFLTRMAGSVIQTVNLPFSVTYGRVPSGVTSRALSWLLEWRTVLMLSLIGTGPFVAIALLIIIGTSNLRNGLVAAAVFVFWTTFPFIQFHGRHTFHLEFVVIAGFMALLSLVGRSVRQATRGAWPAPMSVVRATGLVVGLIAAAVIVTVTARAVQTLRVCSLLGAYEQASTENVAGDAIFDPPVHASRVQQAMIVVSVARSGCERPPDTVTLRYRPLQDRDFSRDVRIPPGAPNGAPARVFFPAYAIDLPNGDPARLTGVEVAPASAACLQIARVKGIDHLLWIDATLTPGWRDAPLHQRLYLGAAVPERLWLKLAHWWPSLTTLG